MFLQNAQALEVPELRSVVDRLAVLRVRAVAK